MEETKQEGKFIYKDIEFIKRAKKPLGLHKTSILFQMKYDEHEKKFIDADLKKNVNMKAFNDKDLLSKVYMASKDTAKIQEVLLESENGIEVFEHLKLKYLAKELFIIDIDNAKQLMELVFENHNDMIYETETDIDFAQYSEFMIRVLELFFSIYNRQVGI